MTFYAEWWKHTEIKWNKKTKATFYTEWWKHTEEKWKKTTKWMMKTYKRKMKKTAPQLPHAQQIFTKT